MASTAAPSAPFLSPRPNQSPAASAAASVTRTSSSARLRCISSDISFVLLVELRAMYWLCTDNVAPKGYRPMFHLFGNWECDGLICDVNEVRLRKVISYPNSDD